MGAGRVICPPCSFARQKAYDVVIILLLHFFVVVTWQSDRAFAALRMQRKENSPRVDRISWKTTSSVGGGVGLGLATVFALRQRSVSRHVRCALSLKDQLKREMKAQRKMDELREKLEEQETEWQIKEEQKKERSAWASRWRELVQLEWEEERRKRDQRFNEWPLSRLVAQGLTLVGLKAKPVGRFFRDPMIEFSLPDGDNLPSHEFARGDEVDLVREYNTKEEQYQRYQDVVEGLEDVQNPPVKGQVVNVAKDGIRVAIKNTLDTSGSWRIDQGVNQIAFERTIGGLKAFEDTEFQADNLRQIVMGQDVEDNNWVCSELSAMADDPDAEIHSLISSALNKSQSEAVSIATRNRVALIQGPPGCGKTWTACSLLKAASQTCKHGVLAVADSHIAVDQLLEGLLDIGVNAIRLGAPARVSSDRLRKASVAWLMEGHPRQKVLQVMRDEMVEIEEHKISLRAAIADSRRRRERPRKSQPEGTSWQLLDDSELEEAEAIVDEINKEDWKMQLFKDKEKLSSLSSSVRMEEVHIIQHIIGQADVVCCTLLGAGSDVLQRSRQEFDFMLLDEASQATIPRAIIPWSLLTQDAHLVLVGDQQQLPPVCMNEEAERGGLNVSLFDQFLKHECLSPTMLKMQYRMHPLISAWPSQAFYEGLLEDGVLAEERPPIAGFDWPSAGGVAFIESGGFERRSEGTQTSWVNDQEVEMITSFIRQLSKVHDPADIGVISPYAGQAARLKKSLRRYGVEAKTVDGFQGCEKGVIVVSCVRSNERGAVGFLSDHRRLNVAMTRAKRGLVVFGNRFTLSNDENWMDWLCFVDNNNLEVDFCEDGTFKKR